jgi:hypothetical protein
MCQTTSLKRDKFQSFLAKFELYIEFNKKVFKKSEEDIVCYILLEECSL